MNKELVSIIIPVFNCEEYINKCINSLISQTYRNIEIVLIDDGSTDRSGILCDNLTKMDERIIVFHKKNEGVSSARNKGLELIKGKYVLFVDADDYVEDNYVETLIKNLSSNEMVVCGYYEEYVNDSVIMNTFKSNKVITNNQAQQLVYSDRGFGGYLWNKVFLKEIIVKEKLRFNEKIYMCEDQLFVINYLLFVTKILVLNSVLYHYRMRKSSMVWQTNDNKKRTFYEAQLIINNIYKKNKIINHYFYYNLCSYTFINADWKKNTDLNIKYGVTIKEIYNNLMKANELSFKEKVKLFIFRHFIFLYFLYMKVKIKKKNRFN